MNREARTTALRLLSAQRALKDRAILDEVGRSVQLFDADQSDQVLLGRVLDRIISKMPQDLVPTRSEDDAVVIARGGDGTAVVLSQLKDRSGSIWVGAHVASFLNHDADSDVDLNFLNITSPGVSWLRVENLACAVSGAATKADLIDDSWCKLIGNLYLAVQEATYRAINTQHPVVDYLTLQETLSGDAGIAFDTKDIIAAMNAYKESTPVSLRPLIDVYQFGEIAYLNIPFHQRDGVSTMEIRAYPVVSGEIDMVWARPGLHIVAGLPNRMSKEDATQWTARFNGAEEDPSDGTEWTITTPWMLGNWRWAEATPTMCKLFFHGYVPNSYHDIIELQEVIGGIVREQWTSWDRYRLHREFEQAVTAGGDL